MNMIPAYPDSCDLSIDLRPALHERGREVPTGKGGNISHRILVVDDEPVQRESLAAWLKEDGYSVTTGPASENPISTASCMLEALSMGAVPLSAWKIASLASPRRTTLLTWD